MSSLRLYSIIAASGLACIRPICVLALQSAVFALYAQSPVIYSFAGSTGDGANPHRAVAISGGGTLYGTTVYGGTSNDGVIYKLAPSGGSWTESVLHNFAGTTADGAEPDGDLLLNGTSLYGTTSIGGTSNDGTVFQEKNSSGTWTESVLYSFTGSGGDGNGPFAGVILNDSVLYGTTFCGGTSGGGTVYSLTPGSPWTESVLYSFGGASGDGQNPHAALVSAGSGVYYGTTYYGGASGNGTVYQLTYSGSAWSEAVLYSFSGGSDGAIPRAGVVFGGSQSTRYGATTQGGGSSNCSGGCGTVYELTYSSGSWSETILYSFTGTGGDGADPYSDVIYSGGSIYGTTYSGGNATNCTGGCGTVYELQP